tara:strand:- start:6563 stop:7330 length:768 start_codon:yes stop_codon:yes gene_type:complete
MINWLGHNIADAGFLINLHNREDRLKRSYNELDKLKITGVERFEAVIVNEEPYINMGCTISHIEIAKKQIENNWNYVLYLEDDIIEDVFYPDFLEQKIDLQSVVKEMVEEIKEHKPDVLWLGVRPEGPVKAFSKTMVTPTKTTMSHAYLGSLDYAKFLVKTHLYDKEGYFSYKWPIDFFISEITRQKDWTIAEMDGGENILNNNIKVKILLPNIFNQGASYSDISQTAAAYEELVRGCYAKYVDLAKLNIEKKLL